MTSHRAASDGGGKASALRAGGLSAALQRTGLPSTACLREFLRINLVRATVYRGQAVIFVLTALFPLVLMTAWMSLVNEVGPVAGWGGPDVASYFVATTVVSHFTKTWLVWDWEEEFRSGVISSRLLRPVHPLVYHITDHLARMAVTGAVLVPLAFAVAVGVDAVTFSVRVWDVLGVIAAVVAGFALSMAISAVFTAVSFWSTRTGQIYGLWWGIGAFLSGWIAPVPLLPRGLAALSAALPFRYMIGFPAEIALGRLDPPAILRGLAASLAWTAAAAILYRLLWRRGSRRYEALGG